MERFMRGDIVVLPFPYTDLSHAKKRPALVITSLPGNDLIVCQITSQFSKDRFALALSSADFERGNLHLPSFIRPNRLFTIDSHIVLYRIGTIRSSRLSAIINAVIQLIRGETEP